MTNWMFFAGKFAAGAERAFHGASNAGAARDAEIIKSRRVKFAMTLSR